MITYNSISLRAIEFEDLPQLLKWRNNPDLRQYFRESRELNQAQQEEWFDKINHCPNTRMFAITYNGGTSLIGACGLCNIDWVNRNAEISIYIGIKEPSHWPRADLNALEALKKYGFDALNLHRLWAEVYDNDTSKNYLLKLANFTHEATLKHTKWHNGHWSNSNMYSLLND